MAGAADTLVATTGTAAMGMAVMGMAAMSMAAAHTVAALTAVAGMAVADMAVADMAVADMAAEVKNTPERIDAKIRGTGARRLTPGSPGETRGNTRMLDDFRALSAQLTVRFHS
jgi:hypothetical protein